LLLSSLASPTSVPFLCGSYGLSFVVEALARKGDRGERRGCIKVRRSIFWEVWDTSVIERDVSMPGVQRSEYSNPLPEVFLFLFLFCLSVCGSRTLK
jgi:hypothetical protein